MTRGTMTVTVKTKYGVEYSDTRSITFGSNDYKLEVTPRAQTIALADTLYNTKKKRPLDGGADTFTPVNIDITVKDQNEKPVSGEDVMVRAITVPGSGGHEGDDQGAEVNRDPDSQTDSNGVTRPFAFLEGLQGTHVISLYPDINPSNEIHATTDSSGMVHIKYTPPIVIVGDAQLKRVVAGTDIITVSLVNHPHIKKTTRISVGYQNFIPFVEDKNVTIDRTGENGRPRVHEDFYCTASTSQSIHYMADNYRAWFDKEYDKDKKNRVFRPLRITAMNLKNGGLSDIDGKWNAPHVAHSNGKCVDIGKIWNKDNELLPEKDIKELDKLYKEEGGTRDGYYPETAYCLHYSFIN